MKQSGRVLVVDDNLDILTSARLLLKKHYSLVKTADDPHQIEELLGQFDFDVIVLDMNFTQDALSGQEGFHWLKTILLINPSIVVIMMTAYGDIKLAVDAIKAGASDFITKPWQNDQLLAAMASAFQHSQTKKKVDQLTRQTQGLSQVMNGESQPFIGQSAIMQQVFSTIDKAAKTDANILITGESGTGKELVARAVHQASLRANKTFINVDMGAITETLFESELFGHKKGAFTDAKSDRIGRFELARGGSIFLDELANLPLNQQAKLLTTLQNREITPVGGVKSIAIDIRLISATNDNLLEAVDNGRFRQDLLYRVNTIEIRLPPLRERKEDIPLLISYYLKHFCHKYNRALVINASDIQRLSRYSWPGNVRELCHAIERAVILTDGKSLDISSIINTKQTPKIANDKPEIFNLEQVEQLTIANALSHFKGNVSQAAKALGLTRGALYRRLDKYEL
ncbi:MULTISPECIES: sigma-54-dependent transcriptional regulator [unclassified Colwellia]|uniref:sigma-54-dependent transcriptional regulator n=1 Tax=unclassified Colwellia TaxID=196834 RepID=UPI0015F62C05|nr:MULTISPECIES: sigma-54 dependent transcriptional regulator [unclassified Colwellia]MBA6232500.1 sigma-54-dependent Fis family transcriptional regulator [Colwellia sp. MB02u-7]MBA6237662.1 sigma-54-dependent Fis family transcriptional regulator [Colwellia sp. MB02u-11]MBA6255355.1 sigma-54-dependent Fis family transcriptional regulator [Colwellia sp. MB3u-28]MBA6261495.1 sigma-54-dependent Fis family transcriptional regulator [Colwellia sp. MB3u-41]MBA6299409.1 sigma-54-dependent Fis family 